jgi:AraC-type DNA-binding domain-containing proteins
MNYYERIDRSVSFIESHLDEDLSIEDTADAAYMSMSSFYRMFLSITGYTVKEYIRKRRLACAAGELFREPQLRVIDAAVKYGYATPDAFTRAFREEFAMNPSDMRNRRKRLPSPEFRRITIMDDYFETEIGKSLDAYPDIKLLKKLPDMETACFKYFGTDPETHAFERMKAWIQQNGIRFNAKNADGKNAYRIFGFNNPDPADPETAETYGYEVCVTVTRTQFEKLPDEPAYGGQVTYPAVMRKKITGGTFAVISIKRDGNRDIGTEIMRGWKRFTAWLTLSRYEWDGRQYLEEHLGFSGDDEHTGGVDLYLPVRLRSAELQSQK